MRGVLREMRNRRGLYYWPRFIQRLICWADGMPQRFVGAFPNQQAANDYYWAHADPENMTKLGRAMRVAARKRLGLPR